MTIVHFGKKQKIKTEFAGKKASTAE